MSDHVTTFHPRFKFVKGEITTGTPSVGFVACGDGTACPMLVTVKQLDELMYRVRDSKWVSGMASQLITSGSNSGEILYTTFTSLPLPTEKVQWKIFDYVIPPDPSPAYGVAYNRRGYVTASNDAPTDKPMTDWDGSYFTEPTYIYVDFPPADPFYITYREAISERSLWASEKPPLDFRLAGVYEKTEDDGISTIPLGFSGDDVMYPSDYGFTTGYSVYSGANISDGPKESDIYGATVLDQDYDPLATGHAAIVQIGFSGEVAWVDENGSGNPFDPLNKLYVGCFFRIENSNSQGDFPSAFHTDVSKLEAPSAKLSNLKLKLSGTENYITASIYGNVGTASTITYQPTTTDWIFEAVEWWPYAKGYPATPFWDSATGEKL